MIEAIKANCRIDSRTCEESRLLKEGDPTADKQRIRFGVENGQCEVKIG